MLKEAQIAIDVISFRLFSFVRPIKIGTVPKGFTTENNAAKLIKNKLIIQFFCFRKTIEYLLP